MMWLPSFRKIICLLGALLIGLVVAFFWGAGHALSPGHGKTVVAAYLVGTRGTAKHAAILGLTVTISHTLGVFALGLVVLFAANFIVPDQLYPIVGVLSGGSIVILGIVMFVQRWRSWRSAKTQAIPSDYTHDAHDHDHDHTMTTITSILTIMTTIMGTRTIMIDPGRPTFPRPVQQASHPPAHGWAEDVHEGPASPRYYGRHHPVSDSPCGAAGGDRLPSRSPRTGVDTRL